MRRRGGVVVAALVPVALLAATGCRAEEPVARRTATFRASDALLANPERGPVIFHQPEAASVAVNREPLDTPEVL